MERKKILIVDDERPIADLIAEFCELFGYEAMALNSGKDILDVVKSYNPDLITLDLMMPEVPGTKVLAILKKDDQTKSIPVIVISSTIGSSAEDPSIKTESLCEGVLPKPITSNLLKEKIQALLNQTQPNN